MTDGHDSGSWWQDADRAEFYRRLHEREQARMRSLGAAAMATATAMSKSRLTLRQKRQLEQQETTDL